MPTRTQSSVVAVFRNGSDAQAAADELKGNGFSADDIYISSYSQGAAAGSTSASASGTRSQQTRHQEGGIKGWFKSLFGEDEENEYDRRTYEDAVAGGGVLLSIAVDAEDEDEAVDIIQKHNPVDVNNQAGTGTTAGAATTTGTAAAGTSRTTAGSPASKASRQKTPGASSDLPKSIPVVQEDVQVGKRAVIRGAVRVYSRVIEQPVEETVTLREERVRVDRQPVNRAADAADLETGRDQVIEVQEMAEEPVVAKQARVVEEVRISKDASERQETVRDTVRRTEVNVENANQGLSGAYDEDFRRDYQTRYASAGGSYEDYAPAYEYGYQAAGDPRYQGRSWDDVESDLRTDYGRRYPNSTWERIKDSIRYGWDKVTGRAKSASASRQQ
jgi:uncharacterized protein (TIGR02271 family)